MPTPERVAGVDVGGTEFDVRFGGRGWLRVGRGWHVYGAAGEERLRIRPKRGFTSDLRIDDPDGTAALELRREGGSLAGTAKSRYLLVDPDEERTLGIYYRSEQLSTRWTYAVEDVEEYAVVDLPRVPFGFGASATVSRLDGTPVCRVDYSVFGTKRTLSFEPTHPRLKLLVLATGSKLRNAYR